MTLVNWEALKPDGLIASHLCDLHDRLVALEAQQPAPQPTAAEPAKEGKTESETELWQLMHNAWEQAFEVSSVHDPKAIAGLLIQVVANWLESFPRACFNAAKELRREANR